MDPIHQLNVILPTVIDLVDDIETDQLAAPTPCDEFTVHDIIDHMIMLGGSFAYLFRGETPPEASAPAAYGRVPTSEFREAMSDLLEGVQTAGAMERPIETPLGTMSGEDFARVVAVDGLVHGWDLAAATGRPLRVDPAVVDAVHDFAATALTDEMRAPGLFEPATQPPADASSLEQLVALTGRMVEPRWRSGTTALHVDKSDVPTKIDAPGAVARQLTSFGDASGYGSMAGEYFSLAAGTDIGPLLQGLQDDTCQAPHWGYMIEGSVVVSFVDGTEVTCRRGEIFYWPPGHSVRVLDDAEVILFSPEVEHVAALDHMLDMMATV